ncbi:hypothetical protein PybrP1_001866 [[Pythium] brassicae (nom. inval.)]|nr:hypothetical protein PybrP1_001866 [[Pythium] brassicae (nom. inval.)]
MHRPPALDRQASTSALSLSSLSSLSPSAPQPPLASIEDAVNVACADVTWELAAVDKRLRVLKQLGAAALSSSSTPPSSVSLMSPPDSNTTPQQRYQSQETQQAGQVADEVESALFACERLLMRAKASSSSSLSGAKCGPTPASRFTHVRVTHSFAATSPSLSCSSSSAASSSRVGTSVTSSLALSRSDVQERDALEGVAPGGAAASAEERGLEARAVAIKTFAARCQREVQLEAAEVQQQQLSLQASFLKELERKYESKKKLSVLALKESFERETKTLVRGRMDALEQEQARELAKLEEELVLERDRVLNEAVAAHEDALGERVKRLKARLLAETTARRRLLETRLQAELAKTLSALEAENEEATRAWESQKRLDLENELFQRRERAATAILRQQEARTAELKRAVEQQYAADERAELEKLKKALEIGAQAQLQQFRKSLASSRDDKLSELRADAARSLELKLRELRQVLERAHGDSASKVRRELETKHRVTVAELQADLQAAHESEIERIKADAGRTRDAALAACRREAAQAHQRQLEALEQTLEMDLQVRSHRAEIELDTSFAQSLESLRERLIESHELELAARMERMQEAKAALLSEAKAFLSIDTSSHVGAAGHAGSEASRRLRELKRQLADELGEYVEILVTDFDELTEEQRILVAKITELTQRYVSSKRQCEALGAQSGELKSALHTLHQQLQSKDAMCKKLYEANEALLKRLQLPTSAAN